MQTTTLASGRYFFGDLRRVLSQEDHQAAFTGVCPDHFFDEKGVLKFFFVPDFQVQDVHFQGVALGLAVPNGAMAAVHESLWTNTNSQNSLEWVDAVVTQSRVFLRDFEVSVFEGVLYFGPDVRVSAAPSEDPPVPYGYWY